MKPEPVFVLLFFLFSFVSCEELSGPDPDNPNESFYFNSFESSSDTAGWYGVSDNNFIEEAPKGGGKQSLKVSGGCVIPHAYYRIDSIADDCSLVLKCWGKNLSNGGSVSLYTENISGSLHISVTEMSWTSYICEDTLHCIAGSSLRLELNSGGILPSSMLVDQIEISKVDL